MDRKTLTITGLLLFGAVIGLALAESVGQVFRLRSGEAELDAYALRLQETAILVDRQSESIINTILSDELPFCSSQELVLMRRLVYASSEVKDIGRIQDDKLICASALGVLAEPFHIVPPDVHFRNMSVTAKTPILIAGEANGFVVQVEDVNLVLNPAAFSGLEEPPRSFAAYLYDAPTKTIIQGFGQTMPLSREEMIASHVIERKGLFYRPLCSAAYRVCVVAAEPRAALLAHTQSIHGIMLFSGASFGDTFVLALILFYQRHRSQQRQLRRAVRKGILTLVYQPIVDLASQRITGMEALVRWTNEHGEIVSPDIFIPLAEKNGFVTEITRHVVSCSLAEIGDLLTDLKLRLTINITAEDLTDPNFFPHLDSCLFSFGVPPSAIGLELTERSTSNHEAAMSAISRLRQAGYTVYIDDFGTGYSSLSYLRDLAVDVIKIDRAFTATVGTNAITESFVPQILDIARQLRLSVVVEGIETAEQAAYFKAAGDGFFGQGWFFSRPLTAEMLRQRLAESPLPFVPVPSSSAPPSRPV